MPSHRLKLTAIRLKLAELCWVEMFKHAEHTANTAGKGCRTNVGKVHDWFEPVITVVLAVKLKSFVIGNQNYRGCHQCSLHASG